MLSSENGNEASVRRNIRRVASDAVQGAGSWVSVRIISFGEAKRITAETGNADANSAATIAMTERLIREHLVDWSWRDDNGNPLPLPSQDANVIDQLTVEEIAFLGTAINGNADPKS